MTQKFCDICGCTIDRNLPAHELVLYEVNKEKCSLLYRNGIQVSKRIIRQMDLCEKCTRKVDEFTSYDIGHAEDEE